MAEIPAPKIFNECRKIISAIPMPIIPLTDKMTKSVVEKIGLGERGTLNTIHVNVNRSKPMEIFMGFITIGDTVSPIFLNMMTANAQKIALSNENSSPANGIVVNFTSRVKVKFRQKKWFYNWGVFEISMSIA